VTSLALHYDQEIDPNEVVNINFRHNDLHPRHADGTGFHD